MLDHEWHHDHVEEIHPTMLECLGMHGHRIFEIERTDKGFKFIECCDSYFGVTLSCEQMADLIEELKDQLQAGIHEDFERQLSAR